MFGQQPSCSCFTQSFNVGRWRQSSSVVVVGFCRGVGSSGSGTLFMGWVYRCVVVKFCSLVKQWTERTGDGIDFSLLLKSPCIVLFLLEQRVLIRLFCFSHGRSVQVVEVRGEWGWCVVVVTGDLAVRWVLFFEKYSVASTAKTRRPTAFVPLWTSREIFNPITNSIHNMRQLQVPIFFVALIALGNAAETIDYRAPLSHLASIRSVNCPSTCYCTATTWNCDSANLTKLPTGYPRTIMYLNLHNNQIDDVPAGVFRDLPFLRVIDLRDNVLTTVKFRSFSDLPTLHTIYLSFNKITSIEVGAFQGMNELRILRLDHNFIPALYAHTFKELPKLEEIRLRYNAELCCVQPLAFNTLPELRQILMYGTKTNTTIFGTYDIGRAISKTTFANGQDTSTNPSLPGCPNLNFIELATMKLHALYPNYFMSNKFLQMVRRIGQQFEVYATDQEECDMLNRASIFSDSYGATVCAVTPSARTTDSPSRREKSHLAAYRL